MASSTTMRELCTSLHQNVLDRSIEVVHNPGPGTYNHKSSIGIMVNSEQKSSAKAVFGKQKREERPEITALEHAPPGPGRYDFNSSVGPKQNASKRQSFPAYSFGLKRPKPKADLTPGPQYNTIASVGSQVSSDKRSMPYFGFGTEDRITPKSLRTDSKKSPGPKYLPTAVSSGATGVRSLVSHKPSAPSFGFGTSPRTREGNPYITTPGPGAYNHAYSVGKQAMSQLPTRPSAKFGTTPRDKRRIRQVPAPVGNRHSAIGKQHMSARSTAPSFSFGGR